MAAALGLRLVRHCSGGAMGAALVEDERGRSAILKAVPDIGPWRGWAASIHLAGRLRATGYPAPQYLEVGTVADHRYTLQEVVPGEVPARLTLGLAVQLLALAERHAGIGGGPRAASVPEWSAYVDEALSGEYRPERVAVVRQSGYEAARLVDEIQALGRRLAGLVLPAVDVVHGDFHHRNVLTISERVTAVIDWEQTTPGDWRYDLCWMAFWCAADVRHVDPAAAEMVRGRLVRLLTPSELAAYSALTALRVLDFAMHGHQEWARRAVAWCERLLAPAWR